MFSPTVEQKPVPAMQSHHLMCFLAFLFALGIVLGVYGAFIEPSRIKITHWHITTNKWTNVRPLRIAVLADTHAIWPWMTPARLRGIVAQANALHPDMFLLLGDYVATHPFGVQLDPAEGVAPYKDLAAPCGVYAVLGNHDLHPTSSWPAALADTGIPLLNNRAVPVTCGESGFWIAGLEDLWWGKADMTKTMTGVMDEKPVLLMMHNPDSFPDVPQSVVLSMAGHTHGGQVRLPFIGSLSFVVPSKFGNRYAYGHIQEDGKDLIVSSGLGMTGLPIRFLNPPEIAIITISGEKR